MMAVRLKDIKKGEYFTLKPIEYPSDSQVYQKDDYDRSEKKYLCIKCNDYLGTGRLLKGDKEVYVDFIY